MSTLGVDSYVELYTTVLGWHQYNVLWEVLTQTGLIFLPFLGILIRHFVEPTKSQQPRSAAITSLHRIELDLFMMVTVMVLAGQPLLSLDVAELNFIKLCRWSEDAKFKSKVVKFDEALSPFKRAGVAVGGAPKSADRAKVPVWWYGVMSFSSGFTLAAKTSLPCMSDVRMMRSVMLSSAIQDPMLIANIQRFQQECYIPTYTFVMMGKGESSDWTKADEQQLQALKERYGEEDMLQLGSRVFLEMTGSGQKYFYRGREAKSPVGEFRYKENNRGLSCYEWWFGSNRNVLNALYPQLKAEVKMITVSTKTGERITLYENVRRLKTTLSEFRGLAYAGSGNSSIDEEAAFRKFGESAMSEPTEDEMYRYAIAELVQPSIGVHGPLFYSQNDFMKGSSGGSSFFAKEWNTLGGLWGILWESLKQFPLAHITQEAAYVVQPLLLMGLYVILPIGLVFSGFSLKFLVVGAAAMFALKFMTYLFHVASWMDQHLLLALAGNQGSAESLKIELLVVGLYFFFPTLLLAVMGWAGLRVGGSLQALYNKVGGTASPLASAGSAAIGTVKAGMRGAGKVGGAAVRSLRDR